MQFKFLLNQKVLKVIILYRTALLNFNTARKLHIKATGGGGSEVNFVIFRHVVELGLNF